MSWLDLVALSALFQSAGGRAWQKKHNWNTDAELSEWEGVLVNDDGRVVGLFLMENNLQGTPLSLFRCLAVRCAWSSPQEFDRTDPFKGR